MARTYSRSSCSKTKVLHVLTGLGFGGTESLSLDIARYAAPWATTIFLSMTTTPGCLSDQFQAEGHALYLPEAANRGNRFMRYYYFLKILRTVRPNVMIIFGLGPDQIALSILSRLLGTKRIFASAGNPAPERRGRWKWRVILIASRLANVQIKACSAWVLGTLKGLGVGLPRGSGVIMNGCDVARFQAASQEARKTRHENIPVRIGMVGRLDPIKDHQTLIRAIGIAIAIPDTPSLQLWIIGTGPLEASLRQLTQALDLAENVEFLGSRPDIPHLLGQLDVFVFSTTRDEGFGIAMAEAMAANLPIVASDAPACVEVLGMGTGTGIIVEEGDANAMALAIRQYALCPSKRMQDGFRAHHRAELLFDTRVCAASWGTQIAKPFSEATAK